MCLHIFTLFIYKILILLILQKDAIVFSLLYRVSIKSFPVYKHLLQEKYVEYKHIFCTTFQKNFNFTICSTRCDCIHFIIQGEHKIFPCFKHLLQEKYVNYKHIFCNNFQQNFNFTLCPTRCDCIQFIIQDEHKVFPCLQTLITRKIRVTRTYFLHYFSTKF